MSVVYEWGYARGQDTMLCAKKVGPERLMLCGRAKSWMPVFLDGVDDSRKCPQCSAVIAGERLQPVVEVREGTCPVCVGRVELDEHGFVAGHNEWSWRLGRMQVTGRACTGAGMAPEVDE